MNSIKYDILVVGKKRMLIPYIKEFILKADNELKQIITNYYL
jgi:ribosomal 30S subunit maturation factor RimM